MRAIPSKLAAQVQFANSTRTPLNVYWLDFNGQRKFYRLLQPGQNYVQPTFVSHPWIMVDKSGRCYGPVFWPKMGRNINEVFD